MTIGIVEIDGAISDVRVAVEALRVSEVRDYCVRLHELHYTRRTLLPHKIFLDAKKR
jgi:hypothetical protein